MGTHTSDGILAIWREGEVRAASPLPRAAQEALSFLGTASIRALTTGVYGASQPGRHPEWRKPTDNYLNGSGIAWRLGELAGRLPDLPLQVLVYRGLTDRQAYDLQEGLAVGYRDIVDTARGLAGIGNAREEADREAARRLSMGQLHIPPAGLDVITDFALAELSADPAPHVGGEIITLIDASGIRVQPGIIAA